MIQVIYSPPEPLTVRKYLDWSVAMIKLGNDLDSPDNLKGILEYDLKKMFLVNRRFIASKPFEPSKFVRWCYSMKDHPSVKRKVEEDMEELNAYILEIE